MDMDQARLNMIEQQIRPWDVLDPTVLGIMRSIPRENFVTPEYQRLAYADIEIPLAHGEFMLHPRVEGRLLQEIAINPEDTCLEIGTGSGYLTACMAQLSTHVDSIDIHSDFIEIAQQRLADNAIANISLSQKNALTDLESKQQYDAILVSAAVTEANTEHFKSMLNVGGRLIMVVGTPQQPIMQATLITHRETNKYDRVDLFETVLKPLHGQSTIQSTSSNITFQL
ncbi:MAG: protein-L-isoaspartate O-methyltransferase [Thiotrichaceae bacterium]|nr:protein-L-isoaspartate O-methyltransferase [Thiotrichaceae bacterium]